MPVSLPEVAGYLNSFLRVSEIPDDERALNGVQAEGSGTVTRVVAAVDVCEATIRGAAERGADLMVVHHGLFWGGLKPLTGVFGRRARLLAEHGIALYSAHLPLDCHPELGNNILLARHIGLTDLVPFGTFEGVQIGFSGRIQSNREELVRRLADVAGGQPRVVPGGPQLVAHVGVITGAGTDALQEAANSGVDTLITGEGPHHSYLLATELGLNLVFGGHYATEVFGVRELAAHISKKFDVPWDFVDFPTGM